MALDIRVLSSLTKLFASEQPPACQPLAEGFGNEVISYQLAIRRGKGEGSCLLTVKAEGDFAAYVQVRRVRQVPVHLPVYDGADDDYLCKQPGLYPDLLERPSGGLVRAYDSRWECLWVTFDARSELPAGDYPVTIRLYADGGEVAGEHTQTVRILPGLLPAQRLQHTRWFHADCLADYYHVPAWSEEHWRIVENFVRCAVEGGVNMILMPVHTPPLDTRAGGERTTVQLVGITVENGVYSFDMSLVRRWIAMCRRCGVEYYEIAHLFTQWGAKHAPKMMATADGEYRQIFGWDTDAAGQEYGAFLKAYVPAIRQVLREEGVPAAGCDLHCFTMSASFVPVGPYKSYNFHIAVKSSLLQDLKYDKQSHAYEQQTWY